MSQVEILEVAPRDGFQSVKPFIATDTKIALIEGLAECGFKRLEIGSFVSPKAIAQMADTPEILNRARLPQSLRVMALVPNAKGLERALEAGVRAFPAERAELLRWALEDPMEGALEPEEISLRALELLERYGLPPVPAGRASAEFAREWEERLVTILRLQLSGPHNTAACRALAKITGEPSTLRPEIWLARWRSLNSTTNAADDAPQ